MTTFPSFFCSEREASACAELVLLLVFIAFVVATFALCWLLVDYYAKQFINMMDAVINVTRGSGVSVVPESFI